MPVQLRVVAAAVAAVPLAGIACADAVDLTTIERTIAKEPAYESGKPRYCLLAFGDEAATRMWLVLDGEKLFADLDFDGDLTDEGEQLKSAGDEMWGTTFTIENVREVQAEGATTEPATHSELSIVLYEGMAESAEDTMAWMSINANGTRRQSASARFATNAEDAPIVHFAGPLHANLSDGPELTLSRSGGTQIYIEIGTPGLGEGTFASIGYSGLPTTFHPQLAIEYPPAVAGETPIEEVLRLPGRC